MVKGSCICGDCQFEIKGEPEIKMVCHCHPCQKMSGGPGAYNILVKEDNFNMTSGITKQYTRKTDSGKPLTYHNCPICSVCMYVDAQKYEGMVIVKVGTIDDREFLDKLGEAKMEIYCKNRWEWEGEIQGADHKETV